jgi:N-acetylmuramoyl-L-alanine amidase
MIAMKLVVAAAIPFLALLGQPADRPIRYITAVRHNVSGDTLKVAIEVSGDFEFRGDFLHNPERAYYDIPRSRPSFDSRRAYSEDLDSPLLKRIRVAETTPGVTRIVLDLNGDVKLTASRLSNPARLMVELRPAGTRAAAPAVPLPPPTYVRPVAPPLRRWLPPEAKAPAPADPLNLPPSPVVRAHFPEFPTFRAETPRPDPPKPEPAQPVPPPVSATESVTLPPAPAGPESAKPAQRTTAGPVSLTRALGLKLNRVVIDPGHGGHDQGTAGPHGLIEKELVLDVSLRLGKLIQEQLGAEVVFTRSDDTYVLLERRTQIANERKADLFLSIHANSSPVATVSGVETYDLNFTDNRSALDVATRENATSQKSMSELRDIIQKISAHDKAQESREFAMQIQKALYAFSAHSFPGEYDRGVKHAPFVVLIGTNMPAVLAEIGFVTNPKEEALLKKPDYRQKLADAIFHGVARYAETLSHFDMAQTPSGK